MPRIYLLLVLTVLAVLALVSIVGTFLPHQMTMSRMMGPGYGASMAFMWPATLTISTLVMILVIGYVIAFPSIRYNASSERTNESGNSVSGEVDPMDILMRVSKADERAVLEVLKESGGVCFQKDITYKTGLSKIKTHRIVARLAERGIIHVKKTGKTNEISVPTWLKSRNSTR